MRHHGLAVSLHTSLEHLQLPEHQAILLFQAIQELLTNVMKHAELGVEVTVSLQQNLGTLQIEVRDNGVGLDPIAAKKQDFLKFGLFSIGERMQASGGTFEVESTPGHGMRARFTLPVTETTVDRPQYSDRPGSL